MRTAFLLAAAAFSVSCSDPASSGPVEGTYELASLNGQPLPYDHALGCCVYLAGRMILTADAFQLTVTSRNKNNQLVSDVSGTGTYTVSGTAVTFQQTKGDLAFHLYDARVSGGTMTLALGGDGPGAADQFRAVFVR